MARYAEFYDISYNPIYDDIRKAFTEHFQDPVMTKIDGLNGKNFSVYAVQVMSQLLLEKWYIFATVDEDGLPLGNQIPLRGLSWKSLQTRKMKDGILYKGDVKKIPYNFKKTDFMKVPIRIIERQDNQLTYIADILPITITFLVRNKYDISSPTGTLGTALDTFNTIITFR